MKNILVVEDDKRTNEIICDYLTSYGYAVHSALNGMSALEIAEGQHIDLAILDVMMPKMNGYELSNKLRQKSDCLIVFLTARADEEDKLKGFEHHAIEYVTKPFSPKVLMARVKALLSYNSKSMKKGALTVDMERYLVKVSGQPLDLTSKEYELLFLLISNENHTVPRQTIIDRIWGYDYYGDGRVLDTYIKTLRRKLLSCASYIKTVIGVGYKFEVNGHD